MSKRVSEETEGRRGDRKERQLCRQVREAVGEALSTLDDDILLDVWVCDVTPAPDTSRLAVLVRGPRDKPVVDVVMKKVTITRGKPKKSK